MKEVWKRFDRQYGSPGFLIKVDVLELWRMLKQWLKERKKREKEK